MKKLIGDIKHILWLLSVAEQEWLKGNLAGVKETILWVKIHLTYKSKKL